jgi:hypothetical protein
MVATVVDPGKDVPVLLETEVLVVGGGPGGVAAAMAAKRGGADVVLVERYGCLGGMATGGLVLDWPGIRRDRKHSFSGICQEIVDGAERMGNVGYYPYVNTEQLRCDPELLKMLLIQMIEREQVKVLLHSWACNAIVDSEAVTAAIFMSKEGRYAVRAQTFIDATGDADIAQFSGAPYRLGHMHQWGGRPDMSMATRFGNVDVKRFGDALQDEQVLARIDQMKTDVDSPHTMWVPTDTPGVIWCMSISFERADALKVEDLTMVELAGRKLVWRWLEFLRANVPGCENAFLMDTATQCPVRASRQIDGRYTFTEDDAKGGRQFDDAIARVNVCGERDEFEIPLRSLVPKRIGNLLAAGRCISAETPTGMHQIRPIAHCLCIGQAAGVAAAEMARNPSEDVLAMTPQIQGELKRQGVRLR